MKFRDILVHIDGPQRSEARLDLAIWLAVKHNARLTGLHVSAQAHYAPKGESATQRLSEAEAMFREKTAKTPLLRAEWLAAEWPVTGVNPVEMINYYGHAKDLIIVGQGDPQERDLPRDLPERVALGSGRPVLIVPYAGTFSAVGNRIVVAWRAGRASTRAVNDAMPFLIDAAEVDVLSITHAGHPEEKDLTLPDICTHLQMYGVKVKGEALITGDIPVANILQNYAWENGCDMVVVGAFLPSMRGGLTLGPVAKYLLEHMTQPVLMSH